MSVSALSLRSQVATSTKSGWKVLLSFPLAMKSNQARDAKVLIDLTEGSHDAPPSGRQAPAQMLRIWPLDRVAEFQVGFAELGHLRHHVVHQKLAGSALSTPIASLPKAAK